MFTIKLYRILKKCTDLDLIGHIQQFCFYKDEWHSLISECGHS